MIHTIHGTYYDWITTDPDPVVVADLCRLHNLTSVVAVVLINRGIPAADIPLFLAPRLDEMSSVDAMPDLDKAIQRIHRAITTQEKILVHGDYDCDGVTSAALAVRALQGLSANVVGYVPRRADGYDLQRAGVDEARRIGATLIITTDCGVMAIDPVAYANSFQIDVVITDHHRPGPSLPDAIAVVNPYLAEKQLAFPHLCGAGVIFRVFDAYIRMWQPEIQPAFRKNFADLAAIGTVADVSPLTYDNRLIVSQGLQGLRANRKVGLAALYLALNLDPKTITAQSIAFQIAPALNAAGRMGDPGIAFELLSTKDVDRAVDLARQVKDLNDARKVAMQDVVSEASVMAISPDVANHSVLVLHGKRWNKGIVGPIASKIMDLTGKPCIMLGFDHDLGLYVGSGRSTSDFNLLEALHECSDLLTRYGGHHHAAGLSVSESNLDAFICALQKVASTLLPDAPIRPSLKIDAEIANAAAITENLPRALEVLEPTGTGNLPAEFLTRGIKVVENRLGKGDTLLLLLQLPGSSTPFKGIRFRAKDWHESIVVGQLIDVVYRPALNVFRGRTSVDLHLDDWRPSV